MDFEIPLLINAEEITNSDHKILTTSWKTNLDKKRNDSGKKRKKRRKVYKYDKMKEEDWVNFRSYIDKDLQKHKERFEQIDTGKELDNLWLIWNTALKTAANKFIPYTYTRPKKFFAHSFKATKMHPALMLMNKMIRKIKNLKPPYTTTAICPELEEIQNKVTEFTEIEIEKIELEDLLSNRETIIKKLKEIKTII